MTEPLEELVRELESVAQRLRTGDVESEEAARLVERCAELADRVGSELDARSRSATEASAEGQERLL
jgi:exonuclease VII small subunit